MGYALESIAHLKLKGVILLRDFQEIINTQRFKTNISLREQRLCQVFSVDIDFMKREGELGRACNKINVVNE